MKAQIRGSLGTQVLHLAYWMMQARKANRCLAGIELNTGTPVQEESTVDYLSLLFRGLPPITRVDRRMKVDLMDWTAVEDAAGEAPRLRNVLRRPILDHGGTVIHVRTGDRSPASREQYLKAAARYCGSYIVGNDVELMAEMERSSAASVMKVRCEELSPEHRAVEDWLWIAGASLVVGPLSMFTLSAQFVKTNLQVRYLENRGSIRMGSRVVDWMGRLIAERPGLQWEAE